MKTRMVCRPREGYKFSHQAGGTLYWERRMPGDSRVERISCSAEWFYGMMRGTAT